MAVKDYSTNPDENTTISGINIAEGCAPSGINNAIRQLMADAKSDHDAQEKTNKELEKDMTGATADSAGASGNVPAPKAGEQNKPLTGGGVFADSLDCNINGSVTGQVNGFVNIIYKDKIIGKLVQIDDSNGFRLVFDTYEVGDCGAFLQLHKGTSSINPGGFNLVARSKDESVTKSLDGTLLGGLVWDGKEIVRSVNGVLADALGNVALSSDTISEHYFGYDRGYIKYKSGFCFQWSHDFSNVGQDITCNLLVPFITDVYHCTATICFSTIDVDNFNPQITNRTTTNFIFNTNIGKTAQCFWIAIGRYK